MCKVDKEDNTMQQEIMRAVYFSPDKKLWRKFVDRLGQARCMDLVGGIEAARYWEEHDRENAKRQGRDYDEEMLIKAIWADVEEGKHLFSPVCGQFQKGGKLAELTANWTARRYHGRAGNWARKTAAEAYGLTASTVYGNLYF